MDRRVDSLPEDDNGGRVPSDEPRPIKFRASDGFKGRAERLTVATTIAAVAGARPAS